MLDVTVEPSASVSVVVRVTRTAPRLRSPRVAAFSAQARVTRPALAIVRVVVQTVTLAARVREPERTARCVTVPSSTAVKDDVIAAVVTCVRTTSGPRGVTAAEAADGADVPVAFVAVAVKV